MISKFVFYINSKNKKVYLNNEFSYFFYSPRIYKLKKHNSTSLFSNLLYFFWFIFSFGNYKILYIVNKKNKEIVHFSNVIPKIFKYSFMKKEDLQITHCYTYPNFRRMNLYSFALYIIQKEYSNCKLWIGSRVDNEKSIIAIEKSGFKKMFSVQKSSFLGIYYKIDE